MRAQVYLTAVLLLTPIAACSSDRMQGEIGNTVAQTAARIGAPTNQFDMGDGRRAFQWVKRGAVVSGPQIAERSCAYTLYAKRIDSRDSLASWQITGYEKPSINCE